MGVGQIHPPKDHRVDLSPFSRVPFGERIFELHPSFAAWKKTPCSSDGGMTVKFVDQALFGLTGQLLKRGVWLGF